MFGGIDSKGENTSTHEVYDVRSGDWSERAPLPTPRDHLAAVVVSEKIYVTGGRVAGNYSNNLSVIEVYDPDSDRWTRLSTMPTPRSG